MFDAFIPIYCLQPFTYLFTQVSVRKIALDSSANIPAIVLRGASVILRPGRVRLAVLLGGLGNPTVKQVSAVHMVQSMTLFSLL